MATYIRVKDADTKHEFDVPEDDWRVNAGLLTRIKDDRYPPVGRPRPPKHHTPPVKPQAARAVANTEEPTDG